MTRVKNLFTLKEIAKEVDKLIKYTLEMQSLTRYKGGEEANIQKLSIWSYAVKKENEEKQEADIFNAI